MGRKLSKLPKNNNELTRWDIHLTEQDRIKMLKQREKEEIEKQAVKRKNTKSYIVYAKRAKTSVSEEIYKEPSDEEVVIAAEVQRKQAEAEEEDESRRINGMTGEDPDRALESLDKVLVRETKCKSHKVREKSNKSKKSLESESSSDSVRMEKIINVSSVPLSANKEKTVLETVDSVRSKKSRILSEKTFLETIESDKIKKHSVKNNAETISLTNISDLSIMDLEKNLVTSTPKEVRKISKNTDKLINNSLQSQRELKNFKVDSLNKENVTDNKETVHKSKLKVRNINELKEKDVCVDNITINSSSNKESSSLESQNLHKSNGKLSQDSLINKLESKRKSSESLVIDVSDDTLIMSSDNEENEKVSEKQAEDIIVIKDKLLELNKLRIMRDKALNDILELNNQTISLRNKEKLDEFTSKIRDILREIGEKQISAKKDDKIADKKKLLENSVKTIENRLSERNSSESSIKTASKSVKTDRNTEEKNNAMIKNSETINRIVSEHTECRGRSDVMESGPKGINQYGGLSVSREKCCDVNNVNKTKVSCKMDYKEQIKKLNEEESALLRRIDKRIRMQGILKKQQQRINMLRRLAGEDEEDTFPTPMEVEKISKKESDKSAEVSRKVFLALQAVNAEGTFCKKVTIKDNENKDTCDINVIVTVKRVQQSANTVKPVKINLTIEDGAMNGEISFVEDKNEIIPQSLDKVIHKFKRSSSSTNKGKENVPIKAKPKIVSDVRISLPRLELNEGHKYSRRSEVSVQKKETVSATKTKSDNENVDKEIAKLQEMLSRAQRKRDSTSYRDTNNDNNDSINGGDLEKGLPRNKKSRRSPLARVLKPVVSANLTDMLPANMDAMEEGMEVPMASQAMEEPEVKEQPESSEQPKASEEPVALEEEPEVPEEVDSQAIDVDDIGEETAPDEDGTGQQSAVVLKYKV
ncbi:unnamed protein product [Lasius platythorax]|uniref:Uncharacterized protein n=1 Tax=Lasius platythorax TaxID=488582 RepID=A0AAV2MYU8_9HYME